MDAKKMNEPMYEIELDEGGEHTHDDEGTCYRCRCP